MERKVGTVSRGIRTPIVREGDDVAQIVVSSVIEAAESEGVALSRAMTSSVKLFHSPHEGHLPSHFGDS